MSSASIILPAYNAEDSIGATIASVLNQRYEDFELLVIDDGSTDGTIDVVKEFRDPRIQTFLGDHAGPAAARNRGLEMAGREFVAFIDADDLWTPDKLALQIMRLEECPDAGAVYSWTVFIDENAQVLFAQAPVSYQGNVLPQMLVSCFVGSGSNILARRASLSAVGHFDPLLKCTDDWDYLLRLAGRYPFVLVPKFQVCYRIRATSVSTDIERIRAEQETILHRAFHTAPNHLQRLRRKAMANARIYVSFLYMARSVEGDGLQRAGKAIRSALRIWPAGLATRRYQNHLLLWFFLHMVPERSRKTAVMRLMKEFGKRQRKRLPSLEEMMSRPARG
jgi:glycosyltransferase involved in cell wall biosynthesis